MEQEALLVGLIHRVLLDVEKLLAGDLELHRAKLLLIVGDERILDVVEALLCVHRQTVDDTAHELLRVLALRLLNAVLLVQLRNLFKLEQLLLVLNHLLDVFLFGLGRALTVPYLGDSEAGLLEGLLDYLLLLFLARTAFSPGSWAIV